MLPAASAFLLVFIYFYPLTLRLCYRGRLTLHWLPRVCGGYARPLALVPGHAGGANKSLPIAQSLLSRFSLKTMLPLLRWLAGHTRLLRLYFRLALAPGACYGFSASVECIFSMRCGDIIYGMIYAWWLYKKGGKKHV